jgi:hypothetical protein
MFYGCAGQLQAQTPTQPSPMMITGEQSGNRRSLDIKLTLTAPEDLKVQEGDRIEAGQIVADRARDRTRLEAQRQQLELQMQRLQQAIPGPPPSRQVPEVAGLPAASFLDEVADIERARLKVEAAERNAMQQQRTLDLLQSMPDRHLPEETIPHETEMLRQRQRELDQARADLDFAEAKLSQAQADRQHEEYVHSLEMSKRAIALEQSQIQRQQQLQEVQRQEQERAYQVAQMEERIVALNAQLFQLSAVRSPFSGVIRRIKYEGQNDSNLIVILSLVADSPTSSDSSRLAPSPNARGDGSADDGGSRGTDD